MRDWVLFDLNGTLLDPRTMAPALGGDEAMAVAALQDTVLQAMAETLAGGRRPFPEYLRAALVRRLRLAGRDPAAADAALPLAARMRPYPEAAAALDRLAAAGLRLGVLTNSAAEAAEEALAAGGLRERFELVIGSDAAGRYKPHPDVYAHALARLDAPADRTWLVAAHWWDLLGARRAGLRVAWVGHEEHVLLETLGEPDARGADLDATAHALVQGTRHVRWNRPPNPRPRGVTMASKWTELKAHGQSVWYDNVARPALESGLLERLMREDGVTGGTSNPSIFSKAVTGSDLYDADIRRAEESDSDDQIFEHVVVADIRRACDLMRPTWEETGGHDGYVSIEEEAEIAFDEERAVSRAHELRSLVDRPNVMIKVPGTEAGVKAFRRLTREGVSVNVTLLFAIERYRQIAEAYIDAVEERHAAGESIDAIASVASFFVSRIDTKVDDQLPEGSPLRGKIAVANAKLAYADVYRALFTGARWEPLAAAGGNVQRPLWASTGTKNEEYSNTLYIDELIGPDTVTTVPDATLDAFRDGGTPDETLTEGVDEAREQIAALGEAGVDLDAITRELERDGVRQFADAFTTMIESIASRREHVTA